MNNYRLLSNLPFMSKITEKALFLTAEYLLCREQLFSRFRPHSTETSLVQVLLNDAELNAGRGKIS